MMQKNCENNIYLIVADGNHSTNATRDLHYFVKMLAKIHFTEFIFNLANNYQITLYL